MNPGRDEEIAASVGAHRDLGSVYDDAIAAGLALGSMVVGTITSASINTDHGNGTWPIIVIWIAITFINMAIFRVGRPSRRDRRSPD
jgi:hypothetical protein